MIDSNNIEIIRDNLKELDQRIDSLDVEIPPHTSGDAGKYLGVDSSGDLEFTDPLPATSGASAGDVLGLVGENKTKGWITPYKLDFSETETPTGMKWIDGSEIYQITFTGNFGAQEASFNYNFATVENIKPVHMFGFAEYGNGSVVALLEHYSVGYNNTTGVLYVLSLNSSFSNGDYWFTVWYVKKPAPETSPENVTKKKKSK